MLRTPRKTSSSAPNVNAIISPLAGESPLPPTPIPISMAQATTDALNKPPKNSTGIYQQSVYLRSRLHRLTAFSHFLQFSHSGPRADKDVVCQLWETLSLGKPLCVLFNLQDIPESVKIVEYADSELDHNPLRKERQRAVALFIMGVNALKGIGVWEKDAPLFSISELVGDEMDTNGFVKVIATVLYLLDKLPSTAWSDKVPSIHSSPQPSQDSLSSSASREDVERANLVRELIETERKYCQDLEMMQAYAEALRQSGIEDADTVHRLFPALGKLTDFQRKLLIHMEATAEHRLDEQDWGRCFIQHEPDFAIYDAYIAGYSQALELAVAEQEILKAVSHIINPLQLPAFLIKPVQRICRYPMLLGSLLKLAPKDCPLHASLAEGVAAVKRIADMANRALREKENEEILQNLLSRVKDWKGLKLDQTGPLLLDDVFGVVGDRRPYTEYHVFLFNRMLLLCRPKNAQQGQEPVEKERKGDWLMHGFKRSQNPTSNSLSALSHTPKIPGTSTFLAGGAVASRKAKTPFSVRGALYVRNIVETASCTTPSYALRIKYRDRMEAMSWTLQCRNDEQMALWDNEIKRLLDSWTKEEAALRRNARVSLNQMKEQMAAFSNPESLESNSLSSMRSALRPAHPYEYTFGGVAERTRARNNSLNLGDCRPDYQGIGRRRSSSVTSMDSNNYGDKSTLSRSETAILVSAPLHGVSYHDPAPFYDHQHMRTDSATSQAATGSQRPSSTTGTRSSLNARMHAAQLPPQQAHPSGPVPPPPDESYRFPYELRTHSRQSSTSSESSIRPLPKPPLNLRQRVGDRVPAPLAPVAATFAASGKTPNSTLPELPSKDPKESFSQRRSNIPLRGPRERGAPTPTSGSLDAPPELKSHTSSSIGLTPGRIGAMELSSNRPSIHKPLPHRPRRGSESSSTTDSVSFMASSEEKEHEYSPLTPDSIGEQQRRASPSKPAFSSTTLAGGQEAVYRSAIPILNTTPVIPIRGASLTSVSTPRTAFHERDREAIYSAGRLKASSESSQMGHPHTPKASSHRRTSSAGGIGRTPVVADPTTATVTVRLHSEGSRFLLKLSYSTSRLEFVNKIRKKIRLCCTAPLPIPLEQMPGPYFTEEEHVSYLNEKGQFVRLQSDYDFSMAWKSVNCRRRDPNDEGILILAVGNTDHIHY